MTTEPVITVTDDHDRHNPTCHCCNGSVFVKAVEIGKRRGNQASTFLLIMCVACRRDLGELLLASLPVIDGRDPGSTSEKSPLSDPDAKVPARKRKANRK